MLLLFGSGCGDSVIVARGATLVSAAQSSDAGFADAERDAASHDDTADGGASDHHPSNRSTPDPHDKSDKDNKDKVDSSTNGSQRR